MAATGGEKSDFGAENHGMMTNYWMFFFRLKWWDFGIYICYFWKLGRIVTICHYSRSYLDWDLWMGKRENAFLYESQTAMDPTVFSWCCGLVACTLAIWQWNVVYSHLLTVLLLKGHSFSIVLQIFPSKCWFPAIFDHLWLPEALQKRSTSLGFRRSGSREETR